MPVCILQGVNGLRLFGNHCLSFYRRTQLGERRSFLLSFLAPAVTAFWALANGGLQPPRSERSERSGRLEAQVSQRPAFQDAQILAFLRGACAYCPSASYNAHHALLSACHLILSAPLNAAGHVPLVLLMCLHDVALQATRPCVVRVTPSVTPPRWFLVM